MKASAIAMGAGNVRPGLIADDTRFEKRHSIHILITRIIAQYAGIEIG